MLGLNGKQSVPYYAAMADETDQIETETRGYIGGIAVTSDLDSCVGYTKYHLDNMRDCLNRVAPPSCRRSMGDGLACAAVKLRNVLSSFFVSGGAGGAAGVGTALTSVPILATSVPIGMLSVAASIYRGVNDPESMDNSMTATTVALIVCYFFGLGCAASVVAGSN